MKITLTEPAVREIRKILLDQPGAAGQGYLRIGIKAGGCGGLTYVVDLCAKPESTDTIIETAGIRIVCDPISRVYLDGLEVDFQDKMIGRGFVFNNPNAKSLCRCGLSFAV